MLKNTLFFLRSLNLYDLRVDYDHSVSSGDFLIDFCYFYRCSIRMDGGNKFILTNSLMYSFNYMSIKSEESIISKSCFFDGNSSNCMGLSARKYSNYSLIGISNYPQGQGYILYTSGVHGSYNGAYTYHTINASDSISCIYTQYPGYSEMQYITLCRCSGEKGLSYGGFKFVGVHRYCNTINCSLTSSFLGASLCTTSVYNFIFRNSGNKLCSRFLASDSVSHVILSNCIFDQTVSNGNVGTTLTNCTTLPDVGYPEKMFGSENCPIMMSKLQSKGRNKIPLFILFIVS